jgi:two-component system copper resistance phosphate regulon response regulator CusR
MRILIIEDEKKTASFLHKGLSESGYVVDTSGDGDEGLLLALDIDYDLIILDVMLPERDGWSILSALRQAGKQMPVFS